jgi:hypothetical protein
MKRYSALTIDKLPLASSSSGIAPFPGRWPTRVAIEFVDGRVYIGKPFRNLQRLVAEKRRMITRLIEFDKKHRIMLYIAGSKKFAWFSNRPFYCYHPSLLGYTGDPFLPELPWFAWNMEPLRIKEIPCYIPGPLNEGAKLFYENALSTYLKSKAEKAAPKPLKIGTPFSGYQAFYR